MIKEIEIENFRCFEHTKISGFERVNLIGGKNNSGKTALLEAILLNQSPTFQSILLLRRLRQESLEFSKSFSERTWDTLFLNKKKRKSKIYTKSHDAEEDKYLEVSITLDIPAYSKNTDSEEFLELSLNSEYSSTLHLHLTSKPYSVPYDDSQSAFIISDSQGIRQFRERRHVDQLLEFQKILFFPASLRLSSKILAEEYDKADFSNESTQVLTILQTIDQSIDGMKTFSIGEPNLYLKRNHDSYLPISLFGDAINRAAEIILKFINNNSKIVLIDEIENGIHYTNHQTFWKALFELSKQFDVQVFATTHSLEMIQAFANVGLSKAYQNQGAYFEMARHYKTNQIIGIKRELDTLDYAIEHGKGVRGE